MKDTNITVVGTGPMGSAVAKSYSACGANVTLCDVDQVHNAYYNAQYIVLAISSATLLNNFTNSFKDNAINKHAVFIVLSKGICSNGQYPYQYLNQLLDLCGYTNDVAVIAGPNAADDILHLRYSTSIVACESNEKANYISQDLSSQYWGLIPSDNIYQIQRIATIKNVLSIVLGAASTLGRNFESYIFTECINMLQDIFNPEIVMSVAGIGDLALSMLGMRNFNMGIKIAQGMILDQQETKLEGYVSISAIIEKEFNSLPPNLIAVARDIIRGMNAKDAFEKYSYL